jgi:lipopolysaccharide export system permease protein
LHALVLALALWMLWKQYATRKLRAVPTSTPA